MLIEVIACSVEDAVAAEGGGAGRIELVRELERGGLTPPLALVESVLDAVRIPVRVMVREADGYGTGGGRAIEIVAQQASRFSALGLDGIVVGFLRSGSIDREAMEAVLGAAPALRATFHHAFDDLPDASGAIAQLRTWPQIDRVLTSGRSGDWTARAAAIAQWDAAAAPGIRMLAGGGVDADAVRILARAGVREAHAGRAARVPATAAGRVTSRNVAGLVEAAGG